MGLDLIICRRELTVKLLLCADVQRSRDHACAELPCVQEERKGVCVRERGREKEPKITLEKNKNFTKLQ